MGVSVYMLTMNNVVVDYTPTEHAVDTIRQVHYSETIASMLIAALCPALYFVDVQVCRQAA